MISRCLSSQWMKVRNLNYLVAHPEKSSDTIYMNEKETYLDWTRLQKLEYLQETCSPGIAQDSTIMAEMVRWMSEDEFTKFYEYFCSNHGIYEDYSKWPDEDTVVERDDNAELASNWEF